MMPASSSTSGAAGEVLRLHLLDGNVDGNPQEAGGREVMVEREGMAELLRAHHGEARCVDEAEVWSAC